ncbi:MBL fold metallo-hydrolase [Mitsuaria sp. GD03876]|uniref:MBL fold metallo-hydrolase n=1 Tax=Mitsuaria sp. GD03876 TaxID=2975399 RepID=UPI002448645F|nr:MBL fold metallo-hydrolase [Mitsuaria sp. GD03876]MDH0866943.1 MBL fold metallo-hydrolase [Mitsuaria sp. GD03876]
MPTARSIPRRSLMSLSLTALSGVVAVLIVGALAMTASRVMSSPAPLPVPGASGSSSPAPEGTQPALESSPQWADGKFHNPAVEPDQGFWKTAGIMWDFLFHKPKGTTPDQPIEVRALTRDQLLAAPDRTLFRLGHSTVLLKLRGRFWLTDPVFSERASPFSWMGPKRFHAPPIALDELPEIEAVILSHDHYDHLDHDTVLALAPKVRHFVTPLGVGQRLVDWGVPAAKVQQFDWWQGTTIAGLQLTATPAQHFSGRGLSDRNSTLWASWVLVDDGLKIFFSGDTGYFDGFKTIGERFGPFDLTLMETGAYDPRWPYVHMQPEQTMQAHVDLNGKRLLPIHNGTFDLAMHRWQDPFERISALARLRNVELVTPVIGAPLAIEQPGATPQWWAAEGAGSAAPLPPNAAPSAATP